MGPQTVNWGMGKYTRFARLRALRGTCGAQSLMAFEFSKRRVEFKPRMLQMRFSGGLWETTAEELLVHFVAFRTQWGRVLAASS